MDTQSEPQVDGVLVSGPRIVTRFITQKWVRPNREQIEAAENGTDTFVTVHTKHGSLILVNMIEEYKPDSRGPVFTYKPVKWTDLPIADAS